MHFDQVANLGIAEAQRTDGFDQRQPQRDAAAVADGIPAFLDDFAQQSRAVLEAAAVLVAALIGRGRQKVLENTVPVRGIKADQVVTRGLRAQAGVTVPAPQVADILFAHSPCAHRVRGIGSDRHRRRRQRHFAAVQVRPVDPGVGQLGAGERAVLVHGIGHFCEYRQVVVVPQPQLDIGRNLRAVVHFGLLGEDDAPAALGLDPAHRRGRGRVAVAAAVAVRHLVKPVFRGNRPDLHRFEQDIVARISCHVIPLAGLPPRHPRDAFGIDLFAAELAEAIDRDGFSDPRQPRHPERQSGIGPRQRNINELAAVE